MIQQNNNLTLEPKNLKAGNFVTISDSSWNLPHEPTRIFKKIRIMSELKKVVVLENMFEISKETLKGWNFCGDVLKIEKNLN